MINIYENLIREIKEDDNGTFETNDGAGNTWTGIELVLASGVEDVIPNTKGFKECWGSECLIAIDALASVSHAMHAGGHALQLSSSVTFYTNGSEELIKDFRSALDTTPQMNVDSRSIKKILKNLPGAEVTIQSEDGTEKTEEFLGAALKVR
ncbi:hypothetical protein ACHAQE_003535 [Botrytis cinerea]